MISSVARQRSSEAQGCYLLFVGPLLIESLQHSSRWRDQADRICVVDCDPATQVARVQSRSGLTPEVIARIMSAQASRADRLAAADDVVLNDGLTTVDDLAHRTRMLHDKWRSEEHTSELQSLMRISYAVFCLKKKKYKIT